MFIWIKVFKNGPSKVCGRQPLKNLRWKQTISLQILKGYLSQILLGPFLNTLTHIMNRNSHCNGLLCCRCAHIFDESFQLFRGKRKVVYVIFTNLRWISISLRNSICNCGKINVPKLGQAMFNPFLVL